MALPNDYRAWRTLRTLVAQVAETTPSDASSFVDLKEFAEDVEVRLANGGSTGATGPSAVVLRFWRATKDDAGSDVIERIGSDLTLSVSANAVSNLVVPTVLQKFRADRIYATVLSFTGGSTPTLAGTVQFRVTSGSRGGFPT